MNTQVYAARLQDHEALVRSSSGGAFIAISDYFLANNNAILCSGYDYLTHQTEQMLIFDKTKRNQCIGSMYMQSYVLNSWKEAIEWLKRNPEKELAFFGLGCQGDAFIKICEKYNIRERVTIVDIICHGVPSPLIWKEYVGKLEREGKISDINFRDKRNGWSKSIGVAKINGKEVSLSEWRRLYSSRMMLRPCCSVCPYTKIDRQTDITIGDFWGLEKSIPEFYNEDGTSLFLIHTDKGAELFDKLRDVLDYRKSDVSKCIQPNLQKPTEHSKHRQAFWRDYETKGIDYIVKKYGKKRIIKKIVRYLARKILRLF